MQVKLEIYVTSLWVMIQPLRKWQLRLINLIRQIRIIFALFMKRTQTGHILAYVEAEVYESLYSDAGLNILGLAVFPSAQGRGIGRQLMERVEELAKSKHYAFIRLNSASHRKEAHLFYERIGYEGNKTQKRFLKIMN